MLPGLLAAFCRRFDASLRLPLSRAYFPPCLAGYGGGLLLTYAALWNSWFGDQGQPALLYLVPCTLGVVAALGAARGQLGQLWRHEFPEDREARLAPERERERAAAARAAEAVETGSGGASPPAALLPAATFEGPSSPSRERLLPPSPFDRSRSGSRASNDP